MHTLLVHLGIPHFLDPDSSSNTALQEDTTNLQELTCEKKSISWA